MRSHAKAPTAGSKRRIGKSKPALLLCVLVACVATLALVVGSASGATTRFLVEVFGSSAQPAFPGDRGMAVDQSTGELYVLETNTDEIRRYNSDGTPSNFSALGSNAIDGEGSEDETPDVGLAIASSRSESQIAIDESGGATDGNIYVTESARDQVSIFNSEGKYLGELNAFETGVFNEPLGVAVDPSGNVYVGDFSSADLIHKYEPAANPPVNGDNSISFNSLEGTSSIGTLAAGVGSSAGFIFVNRFNGELFKLDATSGELKYSITTSASTVWVDPESGHVFAPRLTGTNSEVVEYDASGAGSATKVSAFKPGSTVEGVATDDSASKVYVTRASTENVEVFGPAAVIPDVVTSPPSSNTGTRATLAGTVNPDGVELSECFFEWKQGTSSGTPFDQVAPCAESNAAIGSSTSPVAVHADISGLKPQGTNYQYRLVAVNPNATVNGSNQNFTTPTTVTATAATGVTPTEATLNGTVNPDTATLSECLFEWGEKPALNEPPQQYSETAPCVPNAAGIGTGTSPVAVHADLSGLDIGTVYEYRLKATYPAGMIVADTESVQTAGPVTAGAWAEGVTRTEAMLKAKIDPEGVATTYRFEYGTSAAYGSQTEELSVGSDSEVHQVARLLEGLKPDTTYHYRLVVTSGVAENAGPDQTFATYEIAAPNTDCPNQEFRIGSSAPLPDCRAYEMVSPIDKNGGNIASFISVGTAQHLRHMKSSLEGDKLTYSSITAFGNASSSRLTNQYLSNRDATGWHTEGISPPLGRSVTGSLSPPVLNSPYQAFAPDLSVGWLKDENFTPVVSGGTEGEENILWRDNAKDAFQLAYGHSGRVKGYSDDLSSVLVRTVSPDQVYLSKPGGEAFPIGVKNDGTLIPAIAGSETYVAEANRGDNLQNVISADNSRVFFTANPLSEGEGRIYVRENPTEEQSAFNGSDECTEPAKACTVALSASVTNEQRAFFWGASDDGSSVLFSVSTSSALADLYEVDVDSQTPTLIAHNVRGVAGASEDLSYVYFVSRDVLAPGAIAGQSNLYLHHEGAMTLVGTLAVIDTGHIFGLISEEETVDGKASVSGYSVVHRAPNFRASRVTPDGRHLAFQSVRSLTGYDNADANNGEPDVEVFQYDADADELTCVSCNPSGARPVGAPLRWPYARSKSVVTGVSNYAGRRWTAAWLPTWEYSLNASRALSEDGSHVFFNSYDALVPEDTNGVQDVYQWQERGSGGCERIDGCVSLISSGESAQKVEFVDASADGRDVFFETNSSLLPQDPGLVDMYDARAGGGYPSPPELPECFGDACQSIPAAPNDPTPASANFEGAGDPAPRRNCGAQVSRARKFARQAKALRRKAKRTSSKRRAKALRKRSARLAKRAKANSKGATRCRRAKRRAQR